MGWKTRFFNGTTELNYVFRVTNAEFDRIGGVPNKHNFVTRLTRLAGRVETGREPTLPVTRKIYFADNASLHKCDARCRNAKGHDCQCSCGGANHGAG